MQPAAPSLGAPANVAIAVGPFILQRPIGAGGMGEVWQGVHTEEHVPVAIKVIGPHWARHDGHRRAFQREVRAVAGLAHPAIVAVFDDGVVDEAAAQRSGGRLHAGCPYLVMEYLPRGNLEALLPALDWPLVQVVVEGTLAGLAHAHARGIIHCDLKPGNILLSGWAEVAVKLTDFGVAHALGPDDADDADEPGMSSAGTPAYMAPEQLLGRWRDYGPWTDLYALGCTVWELCCGAPPFAANNLMRLATMHLREAPGPFAPGFWVPDGLEAWLRRLLAKRPQARFVRAADALAALRALPGAAPTARVTWSTVAGRTEAAAERAPTRPRAAEAPADDDAASRRFTALRVRSGEDATQPLAGPDGDAARTVELSPRPGEAAAPPAPSDAARAPGGDLSVRTRAPAGPIDLAAMTAAFAGAHARPLDLSAATTPWGRTEAPADLATTARRPDPGAPRSPAEPDAPRSPGTPDLPRTAPRPPGSADLARTASLSPETADLARTASLSPETADLARTAPLEPVDLARTAELPRAPDASAPLSSGTGELDAARTVQVPRGGPGPGDLDPLALGQAHTVHLSSADLGALDDARTLQRPRGLVPDAPPPAPAGARTVDLSPGTALAATVHVALRLDLRPAPPDPPAGSAATIDLSEEPPLLVDPPARGPEELARTIHAAPVDVGAGTLSDTGDLRLPPLAAEPAPAPAALPFPPSWRMAHDAAIGRPLQGTGLGLVRVRELPLLGREDERDQLWAALARVHAEARPRLVLVRGPSGVGKSRLVEWTAARAHELGAAEVLRAAHGPFGGPAEGLSRMLALHLRCVGLSADETYARCLAGLTDEGPAGEAARLEAAAMTELLCPGEDHEDGLDRPRVRFADARERHHALAACLTGLVRARPALVWLDDAQWGSAALEFVRDCLRREPPGLAALFVATVRDDLLGERPAEAELLAELAALHGVETLSVEPLPEAHHRALMEDLLGLDRALVAAIVARTGGNPLFSVELVGDWISRGLLRPGPQGFSLHEAAEVDLPDDLHMLWQRRVAGLLDRHFPGDAEAPARHALELAAAIGQEIDLAAWDLACRVAGVERPPELASVLIRERLAAATPAGLAFSHGMLRESLDRIAEEAGRKAMHHRTCAEMLRRLAGERGRSEEIARHLVAAGDLADALGPLLAASYEMQLAGQYGRAEAALAEHAALADRLGLPPHDLQRLRGRMQSAWLVWMRGAGGGSPAARAEVDAIVALAEAHGHDDVVGEALRWHGLVARFERRWDDSSGALARAQAAFERVGDAEGLARTALAQAVTLRAQGRLSTAEARLADAERLARGRGLAVLLPRILGNLAEIALQRADWPEAQVRFARALAAAEQLGDRKALALTSGGAGDLALSTGDLAAAEAHYRRSAGLFAALGSRYLAAIELHLAAVDLLRGDPGARARLTAAFAASDPLQAALARLALAACEPEPGALQDHLAAAEALVARAGEARRVLVRLTELAAEGAAARGWLELAARARAFARAQEDRLSSGT